MNAVAAFLDPAHEQLWQQVQAWSVAELAPRPEPMSADATRVEARTLLQLLGRGGWLAPIANRDLRALCLVRDAVAAASPLADAMVAIQGLVGTALLMSGSEAQRARWVPPIVAGDLMAAFAITEPEAGSDAGAVQTRAQRDGERWILSGRKHLISNAGHADVYLVFASTAIEKRSRGISAFLVPADTPGLKIGSAQQMAIAHPLGQLQFDDCAVGPEALVGEVDSGFKLAMMTLDRLRASVGAAACGMASRALQEATSHAKRRMQFGVMLGEHQLVKAKLGRMATDLDASRLLVFRAAWESDRGQQRISASAAKAKSFATEAGQRIVDDAVQIMGGQGVLLGDPVERLYRAIRALRIYEGATDILRLIIGTSVLVEGTAG
jgi:acyl-CoA dehydrogenase